MREIESYYHFAGECRKLAATVKDPKRKKQLEEMADAWTFVANERATNPAQALTPSDVAAAETHTANRRPT